MEEIIKDLIKDNPHFYAMAFEEDIMCLIEAIKDIYPYTKDGKEVKQELLNKLYKEI